MPKEKCRRLPGQKIIFMSFIGQMVSSDSMDEFSGFMAPIIVTFRADVHFVIIFMTSLIEANFYDIFLRI